MAETSGSLYDFEDKPRTSRDRSRSPDRRREAAAENGTVTNGPRWGSAPSYREDRPPRYGGGGYDGGQGSRGRSRQDDKAFEAAKRSRKECRVYVGNLPYQTRWTDLKDLFRTAGNIAFAEVMMTPEGRSRGCGVVEFGSEEEAQRAIRDFNETQLQGRMIHVREDREAEARFGALSHVGGGPPLRRDDRGAFGSYGGGARRNERSGGSGGGGCRLHVGGLNDSVGWQDLKDLFRQAGDIVRADINRNADNLPNGTGYVIFGNSSDAQVACSMFNGAELAGMRLDVREERFTLPTTGAFGTRTSDSGSVPPVVPPPTTFRSRNEPSKQLYVGNLPYSTCNEDLIELFQTTGTVEHAEIIFEGGRAKGAGVVQMGSIEDADVSMNKFQNYMYGNRPLRIDFNAEWRDFSDVRPAVA